MRRHFFMATILALAVGSLRADPWEEALATARTIDEMVAEAQREAGAAPSPLASDAEFLRRVSIDLAGRVPALDLTERYLAGERPDRRQRLVEYLMETPEYQEGWALQWTLWLLGRERPETRVDRLAFREWMETEVIAENMPHDEFVRILLTTTGRSDTDPATNYLLQFSRAPENAAGMVSRHFAGQQIQCAQCHDHRFEEFSQEQFWSMVAYFEDLRGRPIRDDNNRPVAVELIDTSGQMPRIRRAMRERRGRGVTTIQDTDTVVTPTYLDGTTHPRAETRSLTEALAAEITDSEDPRFAQATVNRLWAHFFGRGFVEPLDDFRSTNPVEFPELLDFLAQDFIAHDFDREHLIRAIVMSHTYQRSSSPTEGNLRDDRLYTHARMRALTPEQLFHSLITVSGFNPAQPAPQRSDAMDMDARPEVRSDQRLDRILNQFIFTHSNDEMDETTVFEGTIPQTLFLMNNGQIARGLNARVSPTLSGIMGRTEDAGERAEAIYLAALSRSPSPQERQVAVAHLSAAGPGRANAQAEDLLWALINTSEFLFNH